MRAKATKVVLDTNIVVSSLWGGNPGKTIELWNEGKIVLVLSSEILNEYYNVIKRFKLSDEDIDEFIILFIHSKKTKIVEPKKKLLIIKDDPADNKFIEEAVEGKADFIVTGDKHLQELAEYEGIRIVSPRVLLLEFKK